MPTYESFVTNSKKCAPGEIRITRRGYNRGGTKTKGTSYCAKDRGKPGRGPKTIPTPRKGALGGTGYTSKGAEARHRLLRKHLKLHGYASTISSLQSRINLGSRTMSARALKVFEADKRWVQAHRPTARNASSKKSSPAGEVVRGIGAARVVRSELISDSYMQGETTEFRAYDVKFTRAGGAPQEVTIYGYQHEDGLFVYDSGPSFLLGDPDHPVRKAVKAYAKARAKKKTNPRSKSKSEWQKRHEAALEKKAWLEGRDPKGAAKRARKEAIATGAARLGRKVKKTKGWTPTGTAEKVYEDATFAVFVAPYNDPEDPELAWEAVVTRGGKVWDAHASSSRGVAERRAREQVETLRASRGPRQTKKKAKKATSMAKTRNANKGLKKIRAVNGAVKKLGISRTAATKLFDDGKLTPTGERKKKATKKVAKKKTAKRKGRPTAAKKKTSKKSFKHRGRKLTRSGGKSLKAGKRKKGSVCYKKDTKKQAASAGRRTQAGTSSGGRALAYTRWCRNFMKLSVPEGDLGPLGDE